MVDLYTSNPDAALGVAVMIPVAVSALVRLVVVVLWGRRGA